MSFPYNDLVVQTARNAGKDFDYNDALLDMTKDFGSVKDINDGLKIWKIANPGLDLSKVPYTYSPFFAPLITSAVLTRGTGTPTFIRATSAYVKDFEGLYKVVLSGEIRFTGARRVENLLDFSEALNVNWTHSGVGTITANATDPQGGATAFTFTAGSANEEFYRSVASKHLVGDRVLSSAWVRRRSGVGVISIATQSAGTFTTITPTETWQRFSAGVVTATTTTAINDLKIETSGNAVDFWWPMIEKVTGQTNQNPSEYVSVGVLSTPYQGAGIDGVKYFPYQNGNTVSSNVVIEGIGPYIPTTTTLGYLSEGSTTQLLLNPRDMTTANWTKTTMTVAKTATGIDGVPNSCSTLTATGVNSLCLQTLVAAASSRTYSCFIKRRTGTGTIILKQGTATLDITALINSSTYSLVLLNDNELNVAFGIQINTSGDAIDVDFNQFEAGPLATSPINGATRNAEALTYSSSGNVLGTIGTCYVEVTLSQINAAFPPRFVTLNNVAERNALYASNSTVVGSYDGTTLATGPNASVVTDGVTRKYASSWGSTQSVVASGILGAGGTFDGNMDVNEIRVGSLCTSGYEVNGTIRNVRIWQTILPNNILQGLTT